MDSTKTVKTYQVWALLRNDRGEEAWQPVTKRYTVKKSAQNIANAIWLTTRIEEDEEQDGNS